MNRPWSGRSESIEAAGAVEARADDSGEAIRTERRRGNQPPYRNPPGIERRDPPGRGVGREAPPSRPPTLELIIALAVALIALGLLIAWRPELLDMLGTLTRERRP